MMLPLFHLDWAASAVALAGQFLISRRRWYGWAVASVGNILFLYVDIYAKLWGMVPACMVFIALTVWSALRWRKAATLR